MVWSTLANPILANPFLCVVWCCGWCWVGCCWCVWVVVFVLCCVFSTCLLCCCVLRFVWCYCGSCGVCCLLFVVVFVVRVGGVVVGLDHPAPDSPPPDRPNFRSFFSVSRHHFRSSSLSLCVFSLNFGGFGEDRDPQMCTFGLSACRVKPWRPESTIYLLRVTKK